MIYLHKTRAATMNDIGPTAFRNMISAMHTYQTAHEWRLLTLYRNGVPTAKALMRKGKSECQP